MAPERLATLAEIETALWRELGRAALDRHHEWRTMVLATIALPEPANPGNPANPDDPDGAIPVPDARTVVLREVSADDRSLTLYTDARAAKVTQLRRHPQGMLVAWSRRLGWQLRLRAQLQVQEDGLAVASRWMRLKLTPAANDYLSPLAPGTVPVQPGGPAVPADPPATERGHFALLQAAVQSVDWLELHPQGHRRARFDAAGARWLVP